MASSSPPPPFIYTEMTEEEAELLAEYGTRDVFDTLLPEGAMRDASAYTSDYGGTALFLTGGGDYGAGGADNAGNGKDSIGDADLPALIAMPLDLFVMHTMGGGEGGIVGSTASSALTEAVDKAIGAAKQHSSRLLPAPSSSAASCAYADPMLLLGTDDDVLAQLKAMGDEADAELARRDYHYVPTGEEGKALTAVMFDVYDDAVRADPIEAATAVEAARAEEGLEADPFAHLGPAGYEPIEEEPLLTKAEEALIEAAVDKRIAALKELRSGGAAYAPLYEGEGQALIQSRMDAAHHAEDLCRKRAVFGEMVVSSVRSMATKAQTSSSATSNAADASLPLHGGPIPSDVLAMAAKHAAERDDVDDGGGAAVTTKRAPQPPPESPVRVAVAPRPSALSATAASSHSHSSKGVTNAASSVIDRLVPPTPPSLAPTVSGGAVAEVSNGASTSTQVLTAERQRRRHQRRAWLLQREADERDAMRVEDDAAMRAHRHAAAMGLTHSRARAAVEEAERLGRREVGGEEGLAIADLMRRQSKQLGHLLDWAKHMGELKRAKEVSDALAGEEAMREVVAKDWERALEDVRCQMGQHKSLIDRHMALRGAVVASASTAHQSLVGEEADDWGDLLTFHCREESREALRAADRAAAARRQAMEEESRRQEEDRAAVEALVERSLEHILRQIDIEGLRAKAEGACQRVLTNRRRQGFLGASVNDGRRVSTPPPTASSATTGSISALPAEDGDVLDEAAFRKIQAHSFALLGQSDQQHKTSNPNQHNQHSHASTHQHGRPSRLTAAVLFRTITFALEHIGAIDHASLAKLTVAMQTRRDGAAADLSSTAAAAAEGLRRASSAVSRLRGLDGKGRAQHVCPLVHHLDLSNNALRRIDCDALLGTVFGSLRRLLLAGNGLASMADGSAAGDGGGASASSSSSAFLSEYPRLVQLDVSANALATLDGVQRFSSLTQLVAYGNGITHLPSDLATKCPLLATVEVSRNRIADLAPLAGLVFLQTLDCGRNAIMSLEPIAKLPLLQRLYASNNAIATIPLDTCWVFLRHLMVSDNKLSHLNGLVSCPLLQVLHADSNAIVSIEGLRGCRLLKSVALAFNKIPNVEALLPLGYAGAVGAASSSSSKERRGGGGLGLERLSINDNPLFADGCGGTSSPSSSSTVTAACLLLCPSLRELNSDPVTAAQRVEVHGDGGGDKAALREQELAAMILPWAGIRARQKREASVMAAAGASHSPPPLDGRQHTVASLLPLFALVQREYEAVSLHYSRREQRAVLSEQRLSNNLKAMAVGNVWGTQRDSSDAYVDQQLGMSLLLARHYQILAKACCGGGAGAGSVEAVTDYFRLSFDHSPSALSLTVESGARDLVARFLLRCVMVRRAKAELSHLKATTTRYSDAAVRIQALYRGHRVRRLLASAGLDDDDDVLFQKVSFDDAGRGGGGAAGGGLAAVMRSTLQQRAAVPVFEVKKMMPSSSSTGAEGPARLGSAPAAGHTVSGAVAHHGAPAGRPASQPLGKTTGGMLHPTPPRGAAPSDAGGASPSASAPLPMDEWSVAMRQHIHKKHAKVAKQQADVMRREFVKDPLKARQMGAGGGSVTPRK